jgi:diguanylate cyclase (GGDEF)-like protein
MTGGGEMGLGTRVVSRAGLVWAMGLLVVAYSAGLVLQGNVSNPFVDVWLSLLTSWVPAVVCWLAVMRAGFQRWEVLLAAAAVTSFAAGDTYYLLMLDGAESVPFPSPGDAGYLLFYPLMLAALVVAVRHHCRGSASSVWLDCAVGSLGAASVLAVTLGPVLASALTDSRSLAMLVAVAYPMSDLLLVSAVAGTAALRGVRMGSRWVLLVVGLMVFSAADVVYALQVSGDTYVVGTLLDAGWPIGLALVAMWVDGADQREQSTAQEGSSGTGAAALVVSVAATIAGLGVLVASSRLHLSTLAVVLAAVTLLAATARTQVALRLLARMAELRRLTAITDELTGLPNRRALYAEGRARLAQPRHERQALLMLDLNKFKEVNDSLGHHSGDLLLIEVASRLSAQLSHDSMLARLGGDEFAVLLADAGPDQAIDVAVKLGAALAEPFALEGIVLRSSASVGISLFPDDGPDLSSLLRKADIAMYKAKVSGKGHHIYRSVDDADNAIRLQMVEELRTALADDRLVVHYQPKIDLNTGDVRSVEALVRWNHPTRGLLHPDAFLDVAEDAGLMRALTQVILEIALDQAAAWHADGRRLTIAVNLSTSSLVDADLPEQVAAMLAARDLPPGTLQLEITEDALMVDRDRARNILTRLRHNGVQISVDDFGTGYSSLSYLRDLPIDELKLDRSFVLPMADDARAAALVASTIDLAHSLGLRMVAEGVENDIAYTELTRLGCDQAQGYYMSEPLPADQLDHWLNTRTATDQLIVRKGPGDLSGSYGGGRHGIAVGARVQIS